MPRNANSKIGSYYVVQVNYFYPRILLRYRMAQNWSLLVNTVPHILQSCVATHL